MTTSILIHVRGSNNFRRGLGNFIQEMQELTWGNGLCITHKSHGLTVTELDLEIKHFALLGGSGKIRGGTSWKLRRADWRNGRHIGKK